MNSAKLSEEELRELIFYGLKENKIDIKNIHPFKIKCIINDYFKLCYYFQINYVIGELDTFKRAACLLVAVNGRSLSKDKRINASIALDIAYKMCEKPYWNVGKNFDIPEKLEEVNFKECFENDMDIYNKSKRMLTDSLVYEKGEPLNYHLNLELFYQLALQLKHKKENFKVNKEENVKQLQKMK